ncbi:16S rRNA (adenine(1518)-N(6)/adenine(1519)-N(6))-dimethyltransferase RsmA [Isoptericola sp. NEAU-Y5]|uniref:Ribosomal RNA small subunit methyltransferase A n=1 Tax=Isoptericola luteus TaxID=2879484 RepID=A0ABS7ZEM4_9MICO|nr:16S rRNA (adenine(1518)-N(6)/adenine(1519)-N(6))-dimethyltransferase RsmA [Isoptericola sp. NEAU-Y5]MCA5892927.1 16S rRNA (adenine(1518)-N(6)/adenine(1519)-N(6))-dimethyltransferase RsmA [Isoptericola sp. NEAU-Y5]
MNPTPGALLGPAEIRELAGRLGVRPTKTLGQNFVHDGGTVRKIVRAAGVEPGQRVVEIGPGLGSLTLGLLEAGCSVVAVEIDPVLAGEITETVRRHAPQADFEVVLSDALDVTELPGEPPTALVANLPYNVAVPVLLTFLERFDSLATVLVMVQAEVADRLAAEPGSRTYGIPSVKAAWYADTRRSLNVSRNVFWPVPNVDSALVALERRDPPPTTATRREVFTVVDTAFAQRRKTLRAALSGLFGSGVVAEEALRAAGVDPSLRGERLGVADFARIAEQLHRAPGHVPAAGSGGGATAGSVDGTVDA